MKEIEIIRQSINDFETTGDDSKYLSISKRYENNRKRIHNKLKMNIMSYLHQ